MLFANINVNVSGANSFDDVNVKLYGGDSTNFTANIMHLHIDNLVLTVSTDVLVYHNNTKNFFPCVFTFLNTTLNATLLVDTQPGIHYPGERAPIIHPSKINFTSKTGDFHLAFPDAKGKPDPDMIRFYRVLFEPFAKNFILITNEKIYGLFNVIYDGWFREFGS